MSSFTIYRIYFNKYYECDLTKEDAMVRRVAHVEMESELTFQSAYMGQENEIKQDFKNKM